MKRGRILLLDKSGEWGIISEDNSSNPDGDVMFLLDDFNGEDLNEGDHVSYEEIKKDRKFINAVNISIINE